MKLSLQFGAGNIGRGFLGQLFFESGYHTLFIDVVPELVEHINKIKKYPIKVVGDIEYTIFVENVSALLLTEKEKVAEAVQKSDIIATAVGAKGVPAVAEILSKGIAKRLEEKVIKPLNIIICENLPEPKKTFYQEITSYLPKYLLEPFETYIGLVEASIGRMVPIITEEDKKEHPLLVRVEEYCELPVDADAFKGDIPQIKGMKLCRPFSGYVHRKLYVHNLTHAVCAYLGRLKDYKFIWEAIEDNEIYTITKDAGIESAKAIHKLDGLPFSELEEYINDLLIRYRNRHLGDQIERVAKDPIRKLSEGERLIGSAMYCLTAGITPLNISLGIAGAIFYNGNDESSQKLKQIRDLNGVHGVLK
ncbi:MAG: mannitol dehydrogenase, partial [Candidatus Hydrogenedens sp.]